VKGHLGPGKLAEGAVRGTGGPVWSPPTFVRDYPEETSPLTRAHRTEPVLAEKWDLTSRAEWNSPPAIPNWSTRWFQRERFVAQS
jgi:lysyl-tRNA synthetase class 2